MFSTYKKLLFLGFVFFVFLVTLQSLETVYAHKNSQSAVWLKIVDESEGRELKLEIKVKRQDIMEIFRFEESDLHNTKKLGLISEKLTRAIFLSQNNERCEIRFAKLAPELFFQQMLLIKADILCRSKEKKYTLDWGFANQSPLNLQAFVTLSFAGKLVTHTVSKQKPRIILSLDTNETHTLFEQMRTFYTIGIKHIAFAADHLLFLFALLLACATWKRALLLASTFTFAHSLVLILINFFDLSFLSRWQQAIEVSIATSIVVTALFLDLQLRNDRLSYPGKHVKKEKILSNRIDFFSMELLAAFSFGCIHGLGFAKDLLEMLGAKSNIFEMVLAFNLGVESAQLIFIALMFPVLLYCGRQNAQKRIMNFLVLSVLLLGFYLLLGQFF